MRTIWMKSAVLLLGMSLSGTALLAQATAAAPETTNQTAVQRPQLSAEQKQKLGEIRASARDQVAIIRHDQSLSAEQKQAKLKALHASTRDQMKSVLTPDQQKVFAERRANRKAKFAAKLGLTPDQQGKLKELRTSTHQQREAVLANQSLTNEQKQSQLAQIRQTSKGQMATILTPEQMEQMQQMRMGAHHHKAM